MFKLFVRTALAELPLWIRASLLAADRPSALALGCYASAVLLAPNRVELPRPASCAVKSGSSAAALHDSLDRAGDEAQHNTVTDWPHSPLHRLTDQGAYMVTAGTMWKQHFFSSASRLSLLHDCLLNLAARYGWNLQAWAVFSNHYHFVAASPAEPQTLRTYIRHLHSTTAIGLNRLDRAAGRKVWFQYWDTHLTYERSYFARLNYVHSNAVHHGLARIPSAYPWCSARWFEQKADPAFYKRVMGLVTDRVQVSDDYAPELIIPN